MYKHIATVILLAGSLFLVACAASQPRYAKIENNWGRSCETASFTQILHPDAGKTTDPVQGINGEVADSINKKYKEDFKIQMPPTPVLKLDLDTLGTSD